MMLVTTALIVVTILPVFCIFVDRRGNDVGR